jgi:hypothetical protein
MRSLGFPQPRIIGQILDLLGKRNQPMPAFSTTVSHPLDQQTAVNKLKGLMDGLRDKYKDVASDVQGVWNNNVLNFSLKVMGFAIDGTVTVLDKSAVVAGNLPLAASMFRGRIEESIKTEMEKELAG